MRSSPTPSRPRLDEKSKLDLVVAGTADAIMMVEAGANEVSEAIILEALEAAQQVIKDLVAIQSSLPRRSAKRSSSSSRPRLTPRSKRRSRRSYRIVWQPS